MCIKMRRHRLCPQKEHSLVAFNGTDIRIILLLEDGNGIISCHCGQWAGCHITLLPQALSSLIIKPLQEKHHSYLLVFLQDEKN